MALKTNKSVQKRFRVTGTGKIKKMRAGKRHLLQHKSRNKKRGLSKGDYVENALTKQIRRLLPYA